MSAAEFTRTFDDCVARLTAIQRRPPESCTLLTLTASRAGQRLTHHFGPRADAGADIRSLSKLVTVLTLGAAAARGAALAGTEPLRLDHPLGPLLRVALPTLGFHPAGRWDRVTVRHLLSSTTGHEHGFLFRSDAAHLIERTETDPTALLRHLADQPLTHEPGTHFAYSNAGYYLLSALITELTGRTLADWTGDLLLGPLNIPPQTWTWRHDGPYPAAATGLRLTPDHLHRIADLLRRDGRHHDERLVDADWMRELTTPQVVPPPTPADPTDPLPRAAYGLGVWLCGDGRFYAEGTDGQYLVLDPATHTAVTVTALRADPTAMAAIRRALGPLTGPGRPGPSTLG
ncbi:serine hydrolase [Nakamurella flava]|uniref:Serine hydrolase n=1 Tax=Nakamurella flava TaxID=2576308 RepID=A0A4U6QJP1_9ACTN|nr:serine hydrolase [Nakamurella flava]TKV60296.1 serine hydrolase [Nakamurella flava]